MKSCMETAVTYDEDKGYPVMALTSVWNKSDKAMVAESKPNGQDLLRRH